MRRRRRRRRRRSFSKIFSDWGRRLGGQDLKAKGVLFHASRDNGRNQPQDSE
jgi:hypothetical protein